MTTANKSMDYSGQLSQRDQYQAALWHLNHLEFLKLMETQNLSPQMMNLVRMQRCYLEYLFYPSGSLIFDGRENHNETTFIVESDAPDFLSFSPSLVDILSLVDFNDLPRCCLISRRFYDVITKYSRRMPRLQAHIHIVKEHLDPWEIIVRLERSNKSDVTFHIRKDHILLKKSDVQAISYVYKGYNEDIRLSTGSVEEGLIAVLETLLLRNHCNLNIFESSSSDDNIPLQWFTAIATLAKRCLSRCQSVYVPLRSDLAVIPSILGKRCITLNSPDGLISRCLPPFFKLEFYSEVQVELTTLEQLKQLPQGVKELIEGWQTAEYGIRGLHVAYGQGDVDEWPGAELGTYLRGLGNRIRFGLIGDQLRMDQITLETSISRPSDDRVLHITHWKCRIKIQDNITK